MQRFRFRLDPLLRLRAQLERAARRELARATAALQTVNRQLVNAARGRQEFGEAAARGGSTGALARALEAGLLRQEWRLLGEKRRAVATLETARTSYLQKTVEVGALENLRERRFEDWKNAAQRAEELELDELSRLMREGAK
ncbi:MAG: flagellar export protein FliJ [Planctomycetes bacterium]|nr:flagellar export protein FliJ [Planctomycetota bacterium]